MAISDYWKAANERMEAVANGETPDRVPFEITWDEALGCRISGMKIKELISNPKLLAEQSIRISEFLGQDSPALITAPYAGPWEALAYAEVNGKENEIVWHDYSVPIVHEGSLAGTEEEIDNLIIPDHANSWIWKNIYEALAIIQERTGRAPTFMPSLTWSNVQLLHGSDSYFDILEEPEMMLRLCQKIYDSQMDLYKYFVSCFGESPMHFNSQYGFNKTMLSFEQAWKFEGEFVKKFCLETHADLGIHNCGFKPYWDEMIDKFAEEGVKVVSVNGCRPKELDYWVKFREKYPDVIVQGATLYVNDQIMNGTPEEVEQVVKTEIQTLAPLGRFVVMPTCSAQWGVPLQNLRAVRDAVVKYGSYPINQAL